MVPLYAAHSIIDAHLLKGLLAQGGIEAHILGEFLQGAVGELPPTGFIQVLVDEADLPAALETLEAFEANQNSSVRSF
ncbi:MAG: DUF2007 domain-containing protein [Gammaproteobacteria bacterium]|nr:DUF2007 domain-containing protein [Gammaproteobacteria bacterium]